ncbi:MAG: hypothetical protein R3E32_09500 [Chitinophagales bacterium]
MNTSKSFFPTANSPQIAQQPAISSSTAQLLSITLPAYEFYNLGMGTANFDLTVAEDTVINQQFIPKGAKVNTNFEYVGPFSRQRMGDINLLMIKALSVTFENQTISIETNTINLGQFSDPNNPPLIFINTVIRFEVPIETTLVFEVKEMIPIS